MATEIGSVKTVKVSAFGTPPEEEKRSLDTQDEVFADELVETAPRGALHIQFLDQTDLRLGSDSQVVLDEFVFDPAAGSEKLTIELGQGVFRLITGEMAPEKIEIVTPVATVGVRGTDFILKILATGAILVAVLKGQVLLTPLVGAADPIAINEMETVGIDTDGAIETNATPPSVDIGLGHDAARSLIAMLQGQDVGEVDAALIAAFNESLEEIEEVEDGEDPDSMAGTALDFDLFFLAALARALASALAQDPNILLTQQQLFQPTVTTTSNLFIGTPDADSLTATIGNDTLFGLAGDDVLIASAGNDTLFGGIGSSDTLYGGAGLDTLVGDQAADLAAQGDDDLAFGGAGNDLIFADTSGSVLANGTGGNDQLYGGDGDDDLYGDAGSSVQSGGKGGDDLLYGEGGNDALYGDAGVSLLDGTGGADTLYGGVGDDALFGDAPGESRSVGGAELGGADTLYGGEGLDTLAGGTGGDSLYGDNGADTLSGDFLGSTFGDAVGGNDLLYGGGGTDTLYGDASDNLGDTSVGGADTLYGGDATDVLYGDAGSLFAGTPTGGADTLYGGDGDDTLYGDIGVLQNGAVTAQGGADLLYGDAGADVIYGDSGAVLAGGGTDGNDTLYGGAGADTLYGDSGVDLPNLGTAGNDTIYGDAGDDVLFGSFGVDILVGGTGADTLTGGDGVDTFGFARGDGGATAAQADTITDFSDGVDFIALSGGLIFDDLTIIQSGLDAVITDSTTLEVLATVQNQMAMNLTAIDFVIVP